MKKVLKYLFVCTLLVTTGIVVAQSQANKKELVKSKKELTRSQLNLEKNQTRQEMMSELKAKAKAQGLTETPVTWEEDAKRAKQQCLEENIREVAQEQEIVETAKTEENIDQKNLEDIAAKKRAVGLVNELDVKSEESQTVIVTPELREPMRRIDLGSKIRHYDPENRVVIKNVDKTTKEYKAKFKKDVTSKMNAADNEEGREKYSTILKSLK